MKKLAIILTTIVCLSACIKQVDNITPVASPVTIQDDYLELPLQARPSLEITATVISATQVKVQWRKQGRTVYQVNRNGSEVFQCQCGEYIDNVLPGVYQYKVNNSNTVTVSTFSTTSPKIIRVDFDGGLVQTQSWAGLNNYNLPGSGLSQWQSDSVLFHIRRLYAGYNAVFVTDGPADQVAYITTYSEWFGGAGGVSFIGSFGTGEPFFVFSELLAFRWKDIAFAIAHELGHTLGLYHDVDTCGQGYGASANIMAGNYQWDIWLRFFGTDRLDSRCIHVNQLAVIQSHL